MRLAKRYTLIPGFRSLPPLLTAASTTKAWPSSTFASPVLHNILFACIPNAYMQATALLMASTADFTGP